MPKKSPLTLTKSQELFKKAFELVPGGVLGIRRPYNFVEGEYPIFFDYGEGGNIYDVDGNKYIDMLCAYGPIIIGHREEAIDRPVIKQIQEKGFCFSLTQEIQNQLAERLIGLIPCAEKCIFMKTGSDATTAAVRIARGFTGRNKIIRSGYHGWHDWCVEVKGGVPTTTTDDTLSFTYNKADELEDLLKKHGDEVAGIIVTPVGHPLAKKVEEPRDGFLESVRSLATKHGAVLIFDEIRSGFRVNLSGAGKHYNVKPDMSVFGKAIANGYPISAVVGAKDIMNVVESKVFISSTFFPNALEQIAALTTIDFLEKEQVLEKISEKGLNFAKKVETILAKSPIPAELSGAPTMPFITFPKDDQNLYKKYRTDFYTFLIRNGIFLQPYHHGYIAYRHTEADLDFVANTIEEALHTIKNG